MSLNHRGPWRANMGIAQCRPRDNPSVYPARAPRYRATTRGDDAGRLGVNRYPSRTLVFRLIHLHPALTMAMAFLARRCEARMGLALAVHVKGFGFWLRCSIHSSIAA